MTDDSRHVKVPIWLATVIVSLILAIAGDTWRKVDCLKMDIAKLKTALAAKGLIDLSICQAGHNETKLMTFDGFSGYETYPANVKQ